MVAGGRIDRCGNRRQDIANGADNLVDRRLRLTDDRFGAIGDLVCGISHVADHRRGDLFERLALTDITTMIGCRGIAAINGCCGIGAINGCCGIAAMIDCCGIAAGRCLAAQRFRHRGDFARQFARRLFGRIDHRRRGLHRRVLRRLNRLAGPRGCRFSLRRGGLGYLTRYALDRLDCFLRRLLNGFASLLFRFSLFGRLILFGDVRIADPMNLDFGVSRQPPHGGTDQSGIADQTSRQRLVQPRHGGIGVADCFDRFRQRLQIVRLVATRVQHRDRQTSGVIDVGRFRFQPPADSPEHSRRVGLLNRRF